VSDFEYLLWDVIAETWSCKLGVGCKADYQHCKKITVAKSRDVKTRCNLAEFSKEGYGSKRAVLAMTMMITKSDSGN
jgi:hypothetical protein